MRKTLKSDLRGIETQDGKLYFPESKLKSDLRGIETKRLQDESQTHNRLKSDLRGIETTISIFVAAVTEVIVKIRP